MDPAITAKWKRSKLQFPTLWGPGPRVYLTETTTSDESGNFVLSAHAEILHIEPIKKDDLGAGPKNFSAKDVGHTNPSRPVVFTVKTQQERFEESRRK